MPHGDFKKAVIIDGTGVPLTGEAEHIILYHPDGSLIDLSGGPKDVTQYRSPNGTIYNITVTDDGTIEVIAAP